MTERDLQQLIAQVITKAYDGGLSKEVVAAAIQRELELNGFVIVGALRPLDSR